MTLNEALKVLGTCILATLVPIPDQNAETLKLLLFNAVLEEWLDGDISAVTATDMEKYTNEYGMNALRQAVRVVADKIKFIGDV